MLKITNDLLRQIMEEDHSEEIEQLYLLYNDLYTKTTVPNEKLFADAYFLGLQKGISLALENISKGALETGRFFYSPVNADFRQQVCKDLYGIPDDKIS